MRVRLRDVDADNWLECIALEPAPDQARFLASNLYSLAQAKAEPDCVPLAVYAGDTMVGFVMYAIAPDSDDAWILRLMVDRRHQGRGHGRGALNALLRHLRASGGTRRVLLGLVPENTAARRLYEAAGFRPSGERMHGEDVLFRVLEPGDASR